MSLELSLVIKGDQAGAKKALEDTASGIETLGNKAKAASQPTKDVGEAVSKVATEAPAATTGVGQLGDAASTAAGKFSNFKALAIGAVGGLAAGIVAAGLDVAFGAALTAATEYFDALTNSPENVKADLEAHKGLIASVKGLWNEAEGAASNYGLTSEAVLRVEARSNVTRLDSDLQSNLGSIRGGQGDLFGFSGVSNAARAPFEDAIERFRKDLQDGRADVVAFREEVATIADALPTDSEGFSFAERLLGGTEKAAELQTELQRAVDVYKALQGDAAAAATALGKASEGMTANGTAAAEALPALREVNELLATMGGVTVTVNGVTATGEPGTVGGGFAEGGFTGHGPADQVAGFVHGKEYVFDAESTARIGVSNLEAIRRGVAGYASGGSVGGSSSGTGSSSGAVGSVTNELFSLRDALKQFGTELWNTGDPIKAFASVLSSVSQNYLSQALGSAGDAVMTALGFASGTDNSPGGWSWMNETGSELVKLPRGSTVVPADRTSQMLGGNTTVHNWNVSTPNAKTFAQSRSSVARAASRLVSSAQRHA